MNLHIDQHIIHYERYGSGPNLYCCLHGYGETGAGFKDLALALGESYTFLCPDLPLHGQSQWENDFFGLPELRKVLQALCRSEGLPDQPFGLLGYSMGGRLALAYTQAFPQDINHLVLIAPDGLHQNFWYRLGTQTYVGQKMFRYTMQNPGWLFTAMKWGQKTRLLHENLAKFSHHYLDDPLQRQLLYKRWVLFSPFKPMVARLRESITRLPFPTLVIFGSFDRIIPPFLQKKLPEDHLSVWVLVLEAGHRLLKPQFAGTIAKAILQSRTT